MSLGPSSDKTETQQTSPWGPQADALTQAFQQAQGAYQQSQNGPAAPTDFVAGANANQQNTYQQAIDFANGQAGTAGGQIGAGQEHASYERSDTASTVPSPDLQSFNPSATNNPSSLIDSAKAYMAGQDIPAQVKAGDAAGDRTGA
jgi:hypothetical protein